MSNLEHALRYLAMGLSVIPLKERPEPDLKQVAKEPGLPSWKPYQLKHATPKEVALWYRRMPRAGVGIVTGTISGVVAIDLDNEEALTWAQANLPETPWRTKTSRGEHWFYRHPGKPADCKACNANTKDGICAEHRVPNKVRLDIGEGKILSLDIRGDGGQVVAPPTIHPSGAQYVALGSWEGSAADLVVFPSELFAAKSHVNPASNLIGIMSTR